MIRAVSSWAYRKIESISRQISGIDRQIQGERACSALLNHDRDGLDNDSLTTPYGHDSVETVCRFPRDDASAGKSRTGKRRSAKRQKSDSILLDGPKAVQRQQKQGRAGNPLASKVNTAPVLFRLATPSRALPNLFPAVARNCPTCLGFFMREDHAQKIPGCSEKNDQHSAGHVRRNLTLNCRVTFLAESLCSSRFTTYLASLSRLASQSVLVVLPSRVRSDLPLMTSPSSLPVYLTVNF